MICRGCVERQGRYFWADEHFVIASKMSVTSSFRSVSPKMYLFWPHDVAADHSFSGRPQGCQVCWGSLQKLPRSISFIQNKIFWSGKTAYFFPLQLRKTLATCTCIVLHTDMTHCLSHQVPETAVEEDAAPPAEVKEVNPNLWTGFQPHVSHFRASS